VKRAVGRKTNPVNAVSSDDDSTSERSSTSSCYIDFSFERVAEEATIVYSGLQTTSGDTYSCLHSMLDFGQSTRASRGRMVDGKVQAATFSLWLGSNQGSHVVDDERFWRWSTIYSLVCGESCSASTSASRRINYVILL
jgi:hypothetical protein